MAMEAKRLAAGTPVEETLDVLQRRLNEAEKGASKLTKHLHKYGSKTKTSEAKETARPLKVDGLTDTNKTSKRKIKESLQKSFENMENRVSQVDNTLHSLKVGLSRPEEESFITKDKYDKEIKELRDKYLKEVKKLNENLVKATEECDELKRRDKEVQNELEHIINSMRENQEIVAEKDGKIGDLEEVVEKITMQKSEVELQLEREVALRQSLEDAHDALLMRVRDMETIVDSGRGQINDLLSNWDNAKQEAVATKEAFENEHELRVQLEGLVSQQEQDIAIANEKLKENAEEKKRIENELSKTKRDYKALRQQMELKTAAHDEIKTSYDSLMKDSQKLHEALKIAATDNKALIAQHKDGMQREKDRVAHQMQMQDRLLDNAKEAVLKELEREKAAVRNIENENTELKAELKNQKTTLNEKMNRIKEIEQKYEIDKAQLNSLIEALRKDKEIMIVQKNDKIFELQGMMEELSNEKTGYEMKIRNMREEIEKFEKLLKINKQELEQTINRLNSAEKNQISQKQIESAFGEIMQSKHKLAYENGLLQSKVDQIGLDLKDYNDLKRDCYSLQRKHQDLGERYESICEDMQRLKSECAKKNVELQRHKEVIEKHERNMKLIEKARDEALREAKRLTSHNESLAEKLTSKIKANENQLKLTEGDNKRLAKSFEAVMTSHSKLEVTLEELQIKLGKKDNEIQTLIEERNANQRIVAELQSEMDNLQKKILCLQDVDSDELSAAKEANKAAEKRNQELVNNTRKLERENSLLKEDVEKLKIDIKKKVKQMEEDATERETKDKEMNAKLHRDKEMIETDYEAQIDKLNVELRNTQKKLSAANDEANGTTRKIKKLKDEYYRLKNELEDQRRESENKSKTISEMAVNLEELKLQLENAAYLQTQADISTRQFEDEIEKEKFIRIETESKYMSLRNKEKELERQLKRAAQQNAKASHEYKKAHSWFQRKVQDLETELESARQTQYLLEQTNIEQEKLLENRTEDAKNAVRASRLAINRLKSEVAENLWETKGLKQVLQSERDNATRATQKYERLMESSAKKVEELAKELDRAHEKAKKAR